MELLESEIKKVLSDHHSISSSIRAEEAKIDALNAEIKLLDDRTRLSASDAADAGALEGQRMRNLVGYQSTLVARAASRTELLRALHEDLLLLFLRRKQLRQADSAGGSGMDMVANVSLSSGLSSGNNENCGLPNDCSMPGSVDIMRMSDDQDNLDEVTTEHAQLPLGLKMLQLNMNEDVCLSPEDNNEYSDIQYKDSILDNIAMSILDPNANVDNIFKEAMESSEFPCVEAEELGFKKEPNKMIHVTYSNFARRLTVDFDEAGNPSGPNASAFKRSINSYVCHNLPVRFKQIGDVPLEDYKSIMNVLTERYDFDLNRSYTRKKISSCYRQHKYKLLVQIKKDLERGLEPQRPSYVKKEDWDIFVTKTKDEEFDRISKKNKASRSQQSALSRKGSPTSLNKRKQEGPEQGLLDECVLITEHKPKRGRPRKPSTLPEDSDNNFGPERPSKSLSTS